MHCQLAQTGYDGSTIEWRRTKCPVDGHTEYPDGRKAPTCRASVSAAAAAAANSNNYSRTVCVQHRYFDVWVDMARYTIVVAHAVEALVKNHYCRGINSGLVASTSIESVPIR